MVLDLSRLQIAQPGGYEEEDYQEPPDGVDETAVIRIETVQVALLLEKDVARTNLDKLKSVGLINFCDGII